MNLEFWIICGGLILLGGSCSLAGTWWDKNKKDKKGNNNKNK